ncbi:hypothetical protein [Hoeflea poritis]|uniref:Phage tail protein n=1 Tax=Hoeflea poritis TaxID=2993659 RepID=A0ABT4VMQ7_9HYPH|nr:hypothetical protein [Hoeflea poritis]MDA4845951.1 hypothetical protein [Hoeflea poritis]
MTGHQFIKQSGDALDYEISFERWLGSSDTITSATAIAETTGSDYPAVSDVSSDTQRVKFRMSGGTDGFQVVVNVAATISTGEVKTVPVTFLVRDC